MIRVEREIWVQFKGLKRLWIAGSGPTLDDHDLRRLRGETVWALNAAITKFLKHKNAWWFFREGRVVDECWKKLERWRRWRVIAANRSFHRLLDRSPNVDIFSAPYPEEAIKHRRTVLEDALQVADLIGVEEVYLVGIDHALRDFKPYAKSLMWKQCHFYDIPSLKARGLPLKPVSGPLTRMAEATAELVPKLNLKIYNTSTIYPMDTFEKVDYEDVAPRI